MHRPQQVRAVFQELRRALGDRYSAGELLEQAAALVDLIMDEDDPLDRERMTGRVPFEERDLHEAMALWATLALFQRNPKDFDYPETLQKLFLAEAYQRAVADREKAHDEFHLKQIHQKPEVFKMEVLRTRENQVLVKVEGQLVRTGVFEGQTFAESPAFSLNLTLVRNPNMLANKRYPLGVWSFDYTLN